MMTELQSRKARGYLLTPFPHEQAHEHPSIDMLRQVRSFAGVVANLIQDAESFIGGDDDHAEYLQGIAREAAHMMLLVAENAVKAMSQEGNK